MICVGSSLTTGVFLYLAQQVGRVLATANGKKKKFGWNPSVGIFFVVHVAKLVLSRDFGKNQHFSEYN